MKLRKSGFKAIARAALAATLVLAQAPAFSDDKNTNEPTELENMLRGSKTQQSDIQQLGATPSDNIAPARRVPYSQGEIQLSFAPLVAQVTNSVVNVYATRQAQRSASPFAGDPFFEKFFGSRQPRKKKPQHSLGSGVVVRENGMIITNYHVIKGAEDVKVALHDGREFECDIMLKDEHSDLAVLKIREDVKIKPINLGKSDLIAVGDLVLAIGNPFGVGQTVTSGIVSAIARSRQGINDFGFFIQTDAAINPGNSGGALINMQGQLIGINTAIFSRSGGSNGIGFAIPSDMVNVIIQSAEKGDGVLRPWVGASFQEVTPEIAESLGMDRPYGALIVSVFPGGPADKAGLQAGDVILSINGNGIDHLDALGYRLTTAGIGNRADFSVLSGGKEKSTSLTMELPPETVPRDEIQMPPQSPIAGSVIANLSPAVAVEIGVAPEATGVVITKVAQRSPAAVNGLRPGDILRSINDVVITNTEQVANLLGHESRRWQIELRRGAQELIFARNGNLFRQYRR